MYSNTHSHTVLYHQTSLSSSVLFIAVLHQFFFSSRDLDLLFFLHDGFHSGRFDLFFAGQSATDVKDFLVRLCDREPCLARFWSRKSNWMISPHLPCLIIITIITMTAIWTTPLRARAPVWESGFAKTVSNVLKYIVHTHKQHPDFMGLKNIFKPKLCFVCPTDVT